MAVEVATNFKGNTSSTRIMVPLGPKYINSISSSGVHLLMFSNLPITTVQYYLPPALNYFESPDTEGHTMSLSNIGMPFAP